MERLGGLYDRIVLAMAGKRSPWGKPPGDDDGANDGEPSAGGEPDAAPPSGDDNPRGPRNPWLPGGSDERGRRSANIEDLFKSRGPEGPKRRLGGPGFRVPTGPGGRSIIPIALGVVALVWLFMTSVHFIQPREQAIVTTFGKYSRTLSPGTNMTFPWPFQRVRVENVSQIRLERIPDGTAEKLILSGDQNLINLTYLIRWNIKDLKQYQFQLADPQLTLEEVAEAAMRQSVAEHDLDRVLSGAGRADIEQAVRTRMQAILDAYRSGIAVQGIDIQKTDPPEQVVEAFKDVSAAQQDADADVNRAEAYAQQILARAQGDAASFDKIYEEYRQAPEVTRRRLYYETMESVLAKTDKTIIESGGVTPYLPLPELRRRAQQAPAAPAGGR